MGTPCRDYDDLAKLVTRDRTLHIRNMQGKATKSQTATRRTARGEQEIRWHNVEGSAEAVVAAAGRLGRGVEACRLTQVTTRRTARGQHEIRTRNVEEGVKAVVAAVGRLGRGVVACTVAQAATRRTARGEQEIRLDNVEGSAEAVVAAADRLGRGVEAARLGRTWSRVEEDVLMKGYARMGTCCVCITQRRRANTCMYV